MSAAERKVSRPPPSEDLPTPFLLFELPFYNRLRVLKEAYRPLWVIAQETAPDVQRLALHVGLNDMRENVTESGVS